MADTNCDNEAMRDMLPLLAHDALEGGEEASLRAHLATCAACRAELEVLGMARAAVERATPQVDTARIVAGVQRKTRLRLEKPAVVVPVRKAAPRWMPTRFAAAAASIVLVASASLAVFSSSLPDAGVVTGDSAQFALIDTATGGRTVATAGLSVTGGLSDLSDEDLTTLLAELERVEPTVDAEPASMRRALVDVPETF